MKRLLLSLALGALALVGSAKTAAAMPGTATFTCPLKAAPNSTPDGKLQFFFMYGNLPSGSGWTLFCYNKGADSWMTFNLNCSPGEVITITFPTNADSNFSGNLQVSPNVNVVQYTNWHPVTVTRTCAAPPPAK